MQVDDHPCTRLRGLSSVIGESCMIGVSLRLRLGAARHLEALRGFAYMEAIVTQEAGKHSDIEIFARVAPNMDALTAWCIN
ncbi:hypothetical protein EPA93_25495 [Ktedonosporobacter rubrisoli]|uniref:Uncharacterized protein n=1 Tax=Ktedonosporobacter rubrisoli TaxID=2509675 RepID=A0A4V0YZB6_KTERU|nr:hypothetical protein [Ktedonosporobacter rubrisoli]QBD79151.1 hypothetical protein EPA93_25495 [Ktedonosporobacter rubrisoli]